MQANTLDTQQLADLLSESVILDTIDNGSLRMYVLEWNNQDLLVLASGSDATVIYPCSTFDAESGGSIHDHARYSQAEVLALTD